VSCFDGRKAVEVLVFFVHFLFSKRKWGLSGCGRRPHLSFFFLFFSLSLSCSSFLAALPPALILFCFLVFLFVLQGQVFSG
jgi:hypothetical protein